MARKETQLRVRCSKNTRTKFKQVAADLDPDADHEEILTTFLDAYREEPDLFERIHEFGRSFEV